MRIARAWYCVFQTFFSSENIQALNEKLTNSVEGECTSQH